MEKAHTEEQFKAFLNQLQKTNATLSFYSDFEKITANVEKIAIKLNQLNYLIGKTDMEAAVHELWQENPKVFEVLDILIAVRRKDNKTVLDNDNNIRLISDFFRTPEGVIEYINGTGLRYVLQDKKITNLVDYVFGVETGLDTNARKNRSGEIMEERVASVFDKNGIAYKREVYSTEYDDLAGLGEDLKRFDFAVKTKKKTYLMEVNFYSGGGSKLNEVARSYSELAVRINVNQSYEFVWITDGVGWRSARNKLEEAFYIIPSVYNLTSIKDFIAKIKEEM